MVAVIGISFASIAPLVLIFIAVYFLLRWITYRHLFKHMYVIAHPNGGIMFAVAAKYLLFGVYIHIALMFTFFLTKMAVVPLLIILLLLVAVVIAHMFLKPYEDMVQQLPLQVIASALHKEKSQIATLKNPKHHHQPQQSLSSTSSSVSLFANQQHHHPCTSRKSSSAAAVTLDVTTDISPSCSSSLSADGMNNNVEGNFRHHHPMNSLSSPHPSSSSSSMIANKGLYQDNCLLYPSLQKLLSPYSQNYKDIWIPHDRYDLCSSVITPMLRQRGFLGKIQTDHAFMDIFGRVTVGDTKK